MNVIIIGATPLHRAVQRGHTDVLTLLFSNKADIEAKDNNGMYVLTPVILI